MVLVDTSIWIDHFIETDIKLEYLLNENNVCTHPMVIGELACGNFKNRNLILSLLHALPSIPEIERQEYFIFNERNKLFGTGMGFVDINLLASTLILNCTIYTRDKPLLRAAEKFNVDFK
jgi:predicted nucleic acid-binding protein